MLELSADQKSLLGAVVQASAKIGVQTYLVGGVVRDLLLGYSIQDKDLDIIVAGEAARLAEECRQVLGGSLKTFPRFLTAKLVAPPGLPSLQEVDFATTRRELYVSPGALPTVEALNAIELDLARRDFTMNAIALPLGALFAQVKQNSASPDEARKIAIDYYGGIPDLDQRRLRVLHASSFVDDPTRIFRAARYAARLNAQLVPETRALLEAARVAGALKTISGFRVAMEIRKVASERHWTTALRLLAEWGVLSEFGDAGKVYRAINNWDELSRPGSARAKLGFDPSAVAAALLSVLTLSEKQIRNQNLKSLNLPRAERQQLEELSDFFHASRVPSGTNEQRAESELLVLLAKAANEEERATALRQLESHPQASSSDNTR